MSSAMRCFALGMALVRLAALELPPGFVADTLATHLNAMTAIAAAPDGRIFLADQTGRLLAWRDGRMPPEPVLTLPVTDYWERGLIGLALDPDFPRTPHVFVLRVTDRPFVHHVLSRFTLVGEVADPASEVVLLDGDDQAKLGGTVPHGHQGGVLGFGPDGKLYVSLGEQTAGEPAQRLDTLQGKILRLNPDGSVPADNPFVGQTAGKYGAIFARGVRNSFGLAAQAPGDGGRMFFTDVGGSAFEEVNELVAGGNYGWPHAEGVSTHAGFQNPLHAYPPVIGQSIVGGAFCPTGSAWPEKWRGRFFFADFIKHWIKALDPGVPTDVVSFARGLNGPVALAFAPDGSLLVLNRGAVWRDPKKFVPNAGSLVRIRTGDSGAVASGAARDVPREHPVALGLPSDTARLPRRLTRADREVWASQWMPVTLGQREWHPHLQERTYLALPPGGRLRTGTPDTLVLPPGAVFVREFYPPSTPPLEPELNRIETRLVVVGDPAGYGASYRWDSPHEARCVEDGELVALEVRTSTNAAATPIHAWFPALENGLTLPALNPAYAVPLALAQYHVPSEPTAPTTRTLENGTVPSQLTEWNRAGLFDPPLTESLLQRLPRTASIGDGGIPVELRVRAYLDANCSACHRPGGAARGAFDARLITPLADSGLRDGELVAGDLGIAGARLVVPGDPEKSILYQRLRRTDFFRMPPTVFHSEASPAVPVMAEWILSLKP